MPLLMLISFAVAGLILLPVRIQELNNDWNIGFTIIFISYALWVLPAIILHIDYYQRNKNTEYEILKDKIIVRKNYCENIYMKSDIEEIFVYDPRNFFHRWIWIYRTSFYKYNFVRIDMKNGESLYLTSLLYSGKVENVVKDYFSGIPYELIKRVFCTTRYKSRHEKDENEMDYYGLFKNEEK
ncbi:MAG: hypothetical protein LBI15_05575 [Dysgonamonadaceae bacterium]|nr:hypothetical protein [Dysgonamonadaceae bacterium]